MKRRLHIRLDEDRHARLAAEAARRGVPIAVIVREALDAALARTSERTAAARAILAAAPMPVPELGELGAELDELRARRSLRAPDATSGRRPDPG